jgi:mRNA interferase RelE/StbE
MKYKFEFSKSFNKAFRKLDIMIQKQIQKTINAFINDALNSDIKKLKGYNDRYRLRSGDYRIIFSKNSDKFLILFLKLNHRKEVYNK